MTQEIRKSHDVSARLDELEERVGKLEATIYRPESQAIEAKADIQADLRGLSYLRGLKSALDKCFAILNYFFSKDSRHPGLTPDEFVAIFREKFGLSIPLTTISSSLPKEAGHYVTRQRVTGHP